MNREVHVRFCERLGVQIPGATRLIVCNESSLHRVLQNYFEYYERSRTHLALNKDAPVSRAVEGPANGRIVEVAQVGGRHHRYSAAPPSQTLWGTFFRPRSACLPTSSFFPEIPRQCEFSGIQSGRLADQDFHHLDIFINLADQKRQFA